jgi:hypothetical protein
MLQREKQLTEEEFVRRLQNADGGVFRIIYDRYKSK